MESQNTIVLHSTEEHTINDIISTCQVQSITYNTKTNHLCDRDMQLLLDYHKTTDEMKKKAFTTLYFPLRIRRIMPVKAVYLQEILLESNKCLISKVLHALDNVAKENMDMMPWIELLPVYGMTWDIIHSLYVNGTTDLGLFGGMDLEFGLRNVNVGTSNDESMTEVRVKIHTFVITTLTKDLGFWVQFEVLDQDLTGLLHVFQDHGWIKGKFYLF